ncbi:conserved hypothetical protein [Brochothrix thermosphacta]|uniref:McrB family protein n=1 Tax=Brochothrix thermosphacta TaxID=2756 RepID=UPI000D79F990|nr:AAA family ATPase [Brochothrix thermosphacta]SPP28935.1 conserved hypothetical protein [Brochothrix thermosphacta]
MYISKENVIDSIEYFKKIEIESDYSLFLFLLSKHLGITTSNPVTYKVGILSANQKEQYLKAIWMLGGMTDPNEEPLSKTIMFPSGFKTMNQYQNKTEFKGMIGRIKDTIQKKNINNFLYNDENSILTLKHNYQEVIKKEYLNGNKISLFHLAVWIFRFTKFEFDSVPNSKVFGRVLERTITRFLKISKRDFLWLFEDDISESRLEFSESMISGEELRAELDFGVHFPIYTKKEHFQHSVLTHDKIIDFSELRGDNPTEKTIKNMLLQKKQMVLTGVPGVGKSRYTDVLKKHFDCSEMIQFHSNYTYEEFIGGETLGESDKGTIIDTKTGIFLDVINEAEKNMDKSFLFIIDELNRGDISAIFGETIVTLDRGYQVKLSKKIKKREYIKIPDNLYIVATMNTSDKNIAFLDLAIRRRFAFIDLKPNYDFLSEKVTCFDYDLGNILKKINKRIIDSLGNEELLIGQSYFIPNAIDNQYTWGKETFHNQFNFVLLPTIREYTFNDHNSISAIVGEQLCDEIQDEEDFWNAFSAEFGVK